jgi:hypothetical protein
MTFDRPTPVRQIGSALQRRSIEAKNSSPSRGL